ncbi:exported hypothetical protein [Mesorhizobium escarrei]|uniref:AB hydrolase-1 domain-containing protein n=1 Tax=Mesorhizobium escarrei TaxID=666018 RepID=A0ABN8K204_9HYPH|nr:exported hypothetical protein [Mesorhizobium escarrei]
MRCLFATTFALLLMALPVHAQPPEFPAAFKTREIATNGTMLHVRTGGQGPAVVLLHGYGETGDMWVPMAVDLARDHTVIVPDLRGPGLSARPPGGYDKKTQGADIAGVLDALKIERADLVTHDIGNMVGYAFAVQNPQRVTRFVLIDAQSQALGRGRKSSRTRSSGTSASVGPTWSGWSRGGSGSISTASGTSSRPIQRGSQKPRGPTMPSFTPSRAPCTPASPSSRRSTRTPSTTRPTGRQGQAVHAGAGDRRREVVRTDDGYGHAFRRERRDRGCGPRLRPLDHGGKSAGHACDDPRFPRVEAMSLGQVAALTRRRLRSPRW